MTPSTLIGTALGLTLAAGLGLLWTQVPARRRRLDDRLRPYLGEPVVAASSRAGAGDPAARTTLAGIAGAGRDLLGPLLDRAAERLSRVLGGNAAIQRRLVQAGASGSVHGFRLEQVLWGATAAALALVASLLLLAADPSRSPIVLVIFCCGAAVAGVLARDQRLTAAVRARERLMLAEFPTIADLLALAVSAGEAPAAALERVARGSHGELAAEIRRALAASRTGTGLVAALDQVAERTSLAPLARFVDGVVVALDRGTPLAAVLRAQASDVREVRKRAVLEAGGRKEVAMMLPVVFLVLPVTVVFALFPGIVQISAVVP